MDKVRTLRDIAAAMPFRLQWIGYNRADLISAHPETADLLVESGLTSTFFGIESFEPHSSSLVGKGWSGRNGKRWLKEMQQRWQGQVNWQLGLIVGLPGQTVAQLERDQQWLLEHDLHTWRYSALGLKPGTRPSQFSREAERYGFSFPDSANPNNWVNQDGWNYLTAKKLSIKLNHETAARQAVRAAWGLGEIASLGYDLEAAKIRSDGGGQIAKRRKEFLDNYVTKSLQQ